MTVKCSVLVLVPVVVGVLSGGCGAPTNPPDHPGSPMPSANTPPAFNPVAQQDEMLLVVPPHQVPAGTEVQRCWEMDFPSDTDVDINRIHWEFAKGSHHLHVYLAADGQPRGAPTNYDCFQAVDFDKWHLMVATQNGTLDWNLPPKTGMTVKARQRVLVQTHYLNTSLLGTDGGWAYGAVHLHRVDASQVKTQIGAIFGQDRAIDIAPHAKAHVAGKCQLPGPGQFVAMTGHFHSHGTSFKLYITRKDGTEDLFYQTVGFDQPAWETFDVDHEGMQHLGEGDGFRWECEYQNDSDVEVKFGPREDTQEHCNLFAFYMLDEGQASFEPCVWLPDQGVAQ
jgi:hypothetical protein